MHSIDSLPHSLSRCRFDSPSVVMSYLFFYNPNKFLIHSTQCMSRICTFITSLYTRKDRPNPTIPNFLVGVCFWGAPYFLFYIFLFINKAYLRKRFFFCVNEHVNQLSGSIITCFPRAYGKINLMSNRKLGEKGFTLLTRWWSDGYSATHYLHGSGAIKLMGREFASRQR